MAKGEGNGAFDFVVANPYLKDQRMGLGDRPQLPAHHAEHAVSSLPLPAVVRGERHRLERRVR